MAEPFKNELGIERIKVIANHLAQVSIHFDQPLFLSMALKNLEALSLMERNQQIVSALDLSFDGKFNRARSAIEKSLAPIEQQIDDKGLHSWLVIPLAEYVGQFGLDQHQKSMKALQEITYRFSSEWGIRHFIIHRLQETINTLNEWVEHPSEHVRRLVSEGTRPRLPWGMQLKELKDDPTIAFPLLDRLKDDESEYVRRSVANHLNDVAKDHPDWLIKKLTPWMTNASPQRVKLIRHACRTLIKQGHSATLELLGYKVITPISSSLKLDRKIVQYGEGVMLTVKIDIDAPCDIILDYAIHFQKANGELSAKVFKWKTKNLNKSGEYTFEKFHAIRPITTRKYYDGLHKVEILLNGQSLANKKFTLEGVTIS